MSRVVVFAVGIVLCCASSGCLNQRASRSASAERRAAAQRSEALAEANCSVREEEASAALTVRLRPDGQVLLQRSPVDALKRDATEVESLPKLQSVLAACKKQWVEKHSGQEHRGEYRIELPAGAPLIAVLSILESGTQAGFKLPRIRYGESEIELKLLHAAVAKPRTATTIDEMDQGGGGLEEEAEYEPGVALSEALYNVERPVRLLYLRMEDDQVAMAWADQMVDDAIVRRVDIELEKADDFAKVAAELAGACKKKELGCGRILLEAPREQSFRSVAELIEIVARARGKQEPLSAEFLLLDQTQTVVERASNRIGMPIDFGRLAQAAIQGVIQKNFKQLYACYEEGLSRNPKLRGKIVLRFVVAPAGNVSEVAAIDQGRLPQGSQVESLGGRGGREAGKLGAERFISDTTVTSCVLEAYRGFQFPKPEGGPVKVIYPLVFSPR